MAKCFVVAFNTLPDDLASLFCGKQFLNSSLLVFELLVNRKEVHYFVEYVVRKIIY